MHATSSCYFGTISFVVCLNFGWRSIGGLPPLMSSSSRGVRRPDLNLSRCFGRLLLVVSCSSGYALLCSDPGRLHDDDGGDVVVVIFHVGFFSGSGCFQS
jgi:hypothetical protein